MTHLLFALGVVAGIVCIALGTNGPSWSMTQGTAGAACGMGIAAGLCMVAAAINNAINNAAETLGREIRHRETKSETSPK